MFGAAASAWESCGYMQLPRRSAGRRKPESDGVLAPHPFFLERGHILFCSVLVYSIPPGDRFASYGAMQQLAISSIL
jgi:hypothetical protein